MWQASDAQLATLRVSLADARQGAVATERMAAEAKSNQLSVELRLADSEQRLSAETQRLATAEMNAAQAAEM